jgi:YD repeat-containing protein
MTRYSPKDIQNETTLEFQSEFTYTPFDDLETMQQLFENGSKRNNIYTYRKDNTLEKLTRTRSDRNTIYEYFYDENENRTELHISEGVWRSEYVEFYPDGDPKLVYTYYEEWLQEIATFDEEGYGVLKLWHLDKSGSYQIDYRTPEHKLYKIDYFDDNGNYVKTEHYDENENLISTEYA